MAERVAVKLDDVVAAARAQDGRSLLEHSNDGPLLIIFLRHFG